MKKKLVQLFLMVSNFFLLILTTLPKKKKKVGHTNSVKCLKLLKKSLISGGKNILFIFFFDHFSFFISR